MAERNGSRGPDRLKGTANTDTLRGFEGNDRLSGLAGDDSLTGGAGNDLLDGGAGFDRARYMDDPGGIRVDLEAGRARDGYGDRDRLVGIERVIGSSFDDVLRGSDRDESFSGGAGDDLIVGGGGRDNVFYADATGAVFLDLRAGIVGGGEGSDRLGGIETVTGSNFSDTLLGSGADNLFVPDWDGDTTTPNAFGGGDDVINGRGGTDTVDYSHATGSVYVDLSQGTALDALGKTDTLKSIEVVIGSRFDDELVASPQDTELRGGAGADLMRGHNGDDRVFGKAGTDSIGGGSGSDQLFGGGGGDSLEGGLGNDWLTGGRGADMFVFLVGRDTVTDFRDDTDTIQLLGLADGLTEREVLDEYGHVEGRDAVLDFGGGNVLRVEGLRSLNALADDILLG